MQPENKTAAIHGAFAFDSLLCHLFSASFNQPEGIDRQRSDKLRSYHAFTAGYFSKQGRDALTIEHLPAEKMAPLTRALFHERVHYWQLIGSPLLQLGFTLHLERMRMGANSLGGRPDLIAGQHLWQEPKPGTAEQLEELLSSQEAHFGWVPVSEKMIQIPNWIHRDPLTAMPFLHMPHVNGKILPAYGALLGFGMQRKYVIVPFNIRYLLESAAVVSEALREGEGLPKPGNLDSEEDQLYFGAWEFWRRVHGPRYRNETELAYGFLAAVDLAMMPDVAGLNDSLNRGGYADDEYRSENFSVPYRFGKLAFRSQGLPPLRIDGGEEPSKAVERFQKDICLFSGWPTPKQAAARMSVFLTEAMLQNYANFIENTDETVTAVKALFDTPVMDFAENQGSLQNLWRIIAEVAGAPERMARIGALVLGTMLNVCVERCSSPGKFALPHLYETDLALRFPLPLLIMDGQYYQDIEPGLHFGSPIPINGLQLLHDCVALLTLSPLRNDDRSCGFLLKGVPCWYMRQGFGCPQGNLTEAERLERELKQLGDACHWSVRSSALGTGKPC
ncbi:MAG: hypothetical protein HY911_00015 [Desulfobacterales bacterium]|nr:hypothetical protein [Desulfobacterales bacterium]